MARPVKFSAAPSATPKVGAGRRVVGAKALKFGAAKGGPRGGKAQGGTPNSGGAGGYTPSNDPIPW